MAEITITKQNFDSEVLQADRPVLVDFWAPWCGPCKRLGPVLGELAEEYEGRVKVGKVNVDEQPELAAKYRVVSIPMLVLFDNGKIADTMVGFRPKAQIKEMLEA